MDLERVTEKYPNKIAFADVKEEFSFTQLLDSAKRIGCYVAERVNPHNPIVVYMEKRAYNIQAFLGAAYAGCF